MDNANSKNMFIFAKENHQIGVTCSETGHLISVYNALGQKVNSKTLKSTTTLIDVPAAGVYFVTTGDITKKIIVK